MTSGRHSSRRLAAVRNVSGLAVTLTLAGMAVTGSHAARTPSKGERAAVGRAVLARLERDAPAIAITVRRVAISTQPPGAASLYARFAAALAVGRDRAGRPVGSPIVALVGFSRRFHTWFVVDYGSSEVGCRQPQVFFGGRRLTILRDLGLDCP